MVLPFDNNMMEHEIEPIDFRKMLREERKKAREARKKAREAAAPSNVIQSTTTAAGTTDSETSVEPFTQSGNHDASNDLPPWTYDGPFLVDLSCFDPQSCCLSNTSNTSNNHEHIKTHPPDSIYYVPDLLHPDFSHALWKWLESLPPAVAASQNQTEEPRTTCWHELPHAQRDVAVFTRPFPSPLDALVDNMFQLGVFSSDNNGTVVSEAPAPEQEPPNHILVNRYDAERGILPHTDGPAYHSRTVTLSLGKGGVILRFTPRHGSASSGEQKEHEVLLSGNSMVVFTNQAYLEYRHAIDELSASLTEVTLPTCLNAAPGIEVERHGRISITIRTKKP